MSLELDVDLVMAVGPAVMLQLESELSRLGVGDVAGRRELAAQIVEAEDKALPDVPSVSRTDHLVPADDGHAVPLVEFREADTPRPSKAIYYIHGGGMIWGSPDMFQKALMRRAAESRVPVFAVDYRLAPEHKHPVPVNDCFAGLKWLQAHARELGVDPSKIIALGESAGGGLAAGLALMARDKGLSPPLRQQMLLFPMLDDQNTSPYPAIEPFATWKSADNKTGWDALLGDRSDAIKDMQYAAPVRADHLEGLPPTYIECGQMDILARETVKYASRLVEADVPVELHIYPGQPHGHMDMAAGTYFAKMARANINGSIERV